MSIITDKITNKVTNGDIKILWYTKTIGKAFVSGNLVGVVHKDKYGNITIS